MIDSAKSFSAKFPTDKGAEKYQEASDEPD
jgi:hypothetical protein